MKYILENVSDEKVEEGRQMIKQQGGSISDTSFEVKGVSGRYAKDGNDLIVVIDDKPWLASWDLIKSKLKEFFG